MGKSTVYFTDFRCPVGTSQLDKLKKLCIAAGIKDIDMDGKFVAIKMHFGELGNMAFLRPNYAKVIADLCKEQGGMPFLTESLCFLQSVPDGDCTLTETTLLLAAYRSRSLLRPR